MNSSVYVFGESNISTTAYPLDYTLDILGSIMNVSNNKAQIVIHRNNNVMYYAYVRRLSSSRECLGFCVALNDVMIMNIVALFKMFDRVFLSVLQKGKLLSQDKGKIKAKFTFLGDEKAELVHIVSLVGQGLQGLEMAKLPPLNYSVDKGEAKCFDFVKTRNEDIIQSSITYPYTYIKADCLLDKDDVSNQNYVAAKPDTFNTAEDKHNPSRFKAFISVILKAALFALVGSLFSELFLEYLIGLYGSDMGSNRLREGFITRDAIICALVGLVYGLRIYNKKNK